MDQYKMEQLAYLTERIKVIRL